MERENMLHNHFSFMIDKFMYPYHEEIYLQMEMEFLKDEKHLFLSIKPFTHVDVLE